MKTLLILTVAAMAITPVMSAPCRDAKGKFIKCDAVKGSAAATGNFTKDKAGKCHVVNPAPGQKKGQFMPCPK